MILMRYSDRANRFLERIQGRSRPVSQPAPSFPVDIFYAKGQQQLKSGDYAAAEANFRQATAEISSGLRWPWLGVIRALDRQGKHSQALQETLAVAVASNDSDEIPAVQLPWLLFAGEGVNEQVAEDLREIVRRYPAAKDPWVSLSIVKTSWATIQRVPMHCRQQPLSTGLERMSKMG
jgi:tetratricopeptide (TPR) repeat protein